MELLGHELMHVAQYMQGMNLLKYIWASRYGYRKNHYEIEAYQQGSMIKTALIKASHHQLANRLESRLVDKNIANSLFMG